MTASARAPAPRLPSPGQRGRGLDRLLAYPRTRLFQLGGSGLVALELREPPASLAGVRAHVGERLAVLSRELA